MFFYESLDLPKAPLRSQYAPCMRSQQPIFNGEQDTILSFHEPITELFCSKFAKVGDLLVPDRSQRTVNAGPYLKSRFAQGNGYSSDCEHSRRIKRSKYCRDYSSGSAVSNEKVNGIHEIILNGIRKRAGEQAAEPCFNQVELQIPASSGNHETNLLVSQGRSISAYLGAQWFFTGQPSRYCHSSANFWERLARCWSGFNFWTTATRTYSH